MNNVSIIGNLVTDPILETTASAKQLCRMTVAVDNIYTVAGPDGTRERRNDTSYLTVVTWGKQATSCGTYLSKGSQIAVDGHLTSYTRSFGEEKINMMTITAERVEFLKGIKTSSPVTE